MSVVSCVEVPAPVGALLDRYREYLIVERGLRPTTVATYLWNARLFVLAACGDDVARIESLTAGDVARFVVAVSEGRRASSVNTIVVGVRALLRYFYAVGLIATPLAQATPWLARGRVSTLPRTTVPGAPAQILAGLDRATVAGARDFAIVTLMSRLGLRLGEVIDMKLDDVDWRRGELLVRSKGGWRDPLPLPVDGGEAVAAYLVLRGAEDRWRQLFLRIDPPGPMQRSTVLAAIRRGCVRVGLPDLCSHRLRHTLAVDLLRRGAALPEIGQLLRHRETGDHGDLRQGRHDRAGDGRSAVARERIMSPFETALGDYLAVRRAVGYRLDDDGRLLARFVAHLDARGIDTLTVAVAVEWAAATPNGGNGAKRLAAIRGFARYLQALDPAHEVPPAGVLPSRVRRAIPHLYSEAEITVLMTAARNVDRSPWNVTVETIIGLLWATGMRIGEVLRLDTADVDPETGVLTVWLAKFGKSRLVPLAPSTITALDLYRRQLPADLPTPAMFVGPDRRRVRYGRFNVTFSELLDSTGITTAAGHRPRAHDLRHSFAVRTLLGWYRDGLDVQAMLPRLSTYLGHVEPASTYWYLSAAPELMALAAQRLEHRTDHDGADR